MKVTRCDGCGKDIEEFPWVTFTRPVKGLEVPPGYVISPGSEALDFHSEECLLQFPEKRRGDLVSRPPLNNLLIARRVRGNVVDRGTNNVARILAHRPVGGVPLKAHNDEESDRGSLRRWGW